MEGLFQQRTLPFIPQPFHTRFSVFLQKGLKGYIKEDEMPVIPFKEKSPVIGKDVFIAENAVVIGDVVIGDRSSIWFGCVVRGDVNFIRIGEGTNIQDLSVLHVTKDTNPLIIGSNVTVGHRCVLHGCTIKDRCLIGIGSIILDGVEVGEDCIVAAGSLLPPNKRYPPKSLIMGSPAVIKKELSEREIEMIKDYAERYVEYSRNYLKRE
jgi:carbonic anhydrase/acetyltransferase-like protein (isoleucine patch superfamily)